MNILCAIDSNYIRPLKVLLYSLHKTQSESLHIYLINEDFSDEEFAKFKKFTDHFNLELTRLRVDERARPYLNFFNNHLAEDFKGAKLTESVFYRIYVLPLLPKDIDRILWLDSDTIVVGDLSELYHMDFGGKLVAASDSKYFLHPIEDKEDDPHTVLDLVDKDYFYFNGSIIFEENGSILQCYNNDDFSFLNSGIILFNLKEIRESKIYRKMDISFADNYGFDQSIINNMFGKSIALIDSMLYNCAMSTNYTYGLCQNPLQFYYYKKARIIHYANSHCKPWDFMDEVYVHESDWKKNLWLDLEKEMTREEFDNNATVTEDNIEQNSNFDLKVGFACNNDCRHCVVADKRNSGNMTYEEIIDLIDKNIIANHVRGIQITGGEPSIRKDMPDILKYCWQHGITTVMQTNGTGFADDEFCRKCAPYLDHAHVAIHSCYPEIHDNIVRHPGGMWKRTIEGFKNLQKYGVNLSTQTVLSKFNIESLYDTFKFIQKMAPGVRMSATYPHLMGNAYFYRDEVAFRYSDHKEVILKTVAEFKDNLFTESIPPCYLYPYVGQFPTIEQDLLEDTGRIGIDFSNGKEIKNYQILDLMDRRKGPKCKECILNDKCVGVWKEYFEIFHDCLDLYPIKG